jgi:prepilin-type processing-associated H-X9-DG protein
MTEWPAPIELDENGEIVLPTGAAVLPITVDDKFAITDQGIFIEENGAYDDSILSFVSDVDDDLTRYAGLYGAIVPGYDELELWCRGMDGDAAGITLRAEDGSTDYPHPRWLVNLWAEQTYSYFEVVEYDVTGAGALTTTHRMDIYSSGDSPTRTSETVFNESSKDIDFRVESDGNANMLFVDGGANAVGIGTGAPSATLDVVGNVEVNGQTINPLTAGGVIRACFAKATIADNSATGVFTITCANETGDADAGGYSCYIRGHAQHTGTAASANVASMSTEAKFNRSALNTGAGTNSAVAASSSASSATDAAARDIATFAITVTETSEYINTVNATVDLSGTDVTNAFVVLEVTLLWYGFTTAPVLAAA